MTTFTFRFRTHQPFFAPHRRITFAFAYWTPPALYIPYHHHRYLQLLPPSLPPTISISLRLRYIPSTHTILKVTLLDSVTINPICFALLSFLVWGCW
ncbi:hypothetical protein B0H12DRAFT_1095131 [Mycena haematopus]|nr:hypothetical protein B0H12DRAFT_1095131 [Mycena haematopus]